MLQLMRIKHGIIIFEDIFNIIITLLFYNPLIFDRLVCLNCFK